MCISLFTGDDDVYLPQYLSKRDRGGDDAKSKFQRRQNSAFSHAEPVHASVPRQPRDDQLPPNPPFQKRRPLARDQGYSGVGVNSAVEAAEEDEVEDLGKIRWKRQAQNDDDGKSASEFTQGIKKSQAVSSFDFEVWKDVL